MGWIEFNLKLRDHWKINRLKDILQVRYAEALGLVSCLWTWAGEYAENGSLRPFTSQEIEDAMRWEGEKGRALKAFYDCKLLDKDKQVHDWKKHGIRLLLS